MYKPPRGIPAREDSRGKTWRCEQAWRTEQTRVWLTRTEYREGNAERGSEDHAEFVSLAHVKFGLHSASTGELLTDSKRGRVTKAHLCFTENFL